MTKGYSNGRNDEEREQGSDYFSAFSSRDSSVEKQNSIEIPSINLPTGGGAIKGIEEKFQVNAVSGTASVGIPIQLSPSRHSFVPSVGLNYNSGGGNSPYGIGWDLAIPRITRKTENLLPVYKDEEESDTFILSDAEDLVPFLENDLDGLKRYRRQKNENGVSFTVKRYRPRIEGLFAVIEKWKNNANGETHWRSITGNNVHSFYGATPESRLTDPHDSSKVYEWKLCRTHDDKGNICIYEYKKEDFAGIKKRASEKNRTNNCTQTYLKRIFYGNRQPYYSGDVLPGANDFLFKVVFDFGEHDTSANVPQDIDLEKNVWACRKDPFSNYRAGFEIRTYRRLNRVLMFHCFDAPELPHNPYLVNSLELFYDDDLDLTGNEKKIPGFSFLVKARQNGHLWNAAANSYSTKFLPEMEFTFQPHEWNTKIEKVTEENSLNAPFGISDRQYLWIDLFSEGISGILTEQSGGWFYKSNLGGGNFSPARAVFPKPNFLGLTSGKTSILELEGDGTKYLVQHNTEPKGFFKLNEEENWEPFKNFETFPNFKSSEANIRLIDLNGDGISDLLQTEDENFRWFAGRGEKGFALSETLSREIDEEKGPVAVFADREQSIFLADINGDGLTDVVRIRNSEICYWANLGYGKFSGKVTMDNSPVFDSPDQFNPVNLRLADIDGSGTIDIVYLGKNDFRVWLNLNGNEWTSEPQIISAFPDIDDLSDVAVLDFLGMGTACIVYSSKLPQNSNFPIQYIDLMGGKKPNLLTKYENNCGKEVSIEYRPSTKFYLEDKAAGKKWITKLPFPIHCISKVRSEDKIRETVFTSSYRYAHGYFDRIENEFRGFARVEQLDTEEFSQFKLNVAKNVVAEEFHQPPVRTVSWFHTGAFLTKDKILHQCKTEYFQNSEFAEYDLPEPVLPDDLTNDELDEALRALKGTSLRTEIYADDDSPLSSKPYSVSNSTFEIRRVQSRFNNKHAAFLVIPSESVSYLYERNPADPHISHAIIIETDELGNVRKSASVIYPRTARPLGQNKIPDKVWDEQNKLHIAYSEVFFTNDVIDDNLSIYQLRAGFESKAYELAGITPKPASFYFKKADLIADIGAATEILFEEEFNGSKQKRLSAHGRIYFFDNSLTSALPLGELSALGIGQKSYRLTFTKNLVSKYYGSKVSDQMLLDAKYVHSEGDEHWWTQSGTSIYAANPKSNFYTPIGFRDVFGNENLAEYDALTLLVNSTTNAIGDQQTAINDYRTLSPQMLIDVNLNRSAVQTDELGMVVKSAVMGKVGTGEGDTLSDPTARMEYDYFNWKNNRKPNFVHSFAREKHGAANPRWQESYVYSDGGGGVIMTKSQAEPGKALHWNSVTKQLDEINANPRWIGNGRTIFNNKGKPIKQFEPFFSSTHEYESEDALVETGFSALLFYDPIGRNIKTEMPNGTFTKVELDSWFFKSFDFNDTVKESRWFTERGSPDPDIDPEPADPEQRAAWLAAKHHNTPAIIHTNSLGKPFYSISDYGNGKTVRVHAENDLIGRFSFLFDQMDRKIAESYTNLAGTVIYGKTAEKGEQWVFVDVLGRLVRTWDNDLREYRSTYDKLHRPISAFVKEGASEYLFSYILYADYFLSRSTAQSLNMKGRAVRVYDQAGSLAFTQADFKGNILGVDRRLAKDYKAHIYDWKILEGLNDLAAIDAVADPLLETETFSGAGEVDALNRPIIVTAPGGTIYQPVYNEANFLDSLQVKLRGQGDFITFLEEQDYDAKGQRQYVKYGNGTITKYFYDPKTYRLTNLLTTLTGGDPALQAIQNLSYTFDPVSNITQIRDQAQQRHFFANSVVSAENKFEYDAVYQLKKATGREHAGFGGNSQRNHLDIPFIAQLPHFNDVNAVRNYEEQYDYDDCGNIQRMKHIALNANWTKRYRYAYEDDPTNKTNQLKATSAEGDADGVFSSKYFHDSHGNMTSMPHLSAPDSLIWNFIDQLKEVNLGGGGTAFYVYGVGGNRVRKIIERQGGLIQERIYLGTVEIYRERQGSNAPHLERQTVHISDNTGKIAQVDIKTVDTANSDPSNPLNTNLIRYQYGNHLGSAVLEIDANGTIISYEEYHPFGTSAYRVSKSNVDLSLKRYRFSGKEHDEETGFYYFGARYYAAWLGRWTSSDPIGFVDGFNLYRYCSNNPIMFSDPNGTDGEVGSHPYGAFYTAKTKAEILNYVNNNEIFITFFPDGSTEGIPMAVRLTATDAAQRKDENNREYWYLTKYKITSARRLKPADSEPEEDSDEGAPSDSPAPSNAPANGGTPGDGKAPSTAPNAGDGGSGGNQDSGTPQTPGPSGDSKGPEGPSVGTPLSLVGPGAERFIWQYPFAGVRGAQRGRILEWMFGNTWRDNTPNYDIETATSVQQIKSTDSYGKVGQIVRDATRDADVAVTANPTTTMAGKRPQAVIVTPTDAPPAVDADIANALGRGRRTFNNNPLPPEHVRGLPGGWGTAARGLSVVGTGLSAVSLVNDIRKGDAPMAGADALGTVGGGLETYALFSGSGATVLGVSAMSAGLVVGGAGLAIGSGISAYRAYKRGDTVGVVAGLIGVAAGIAIVAGVVFGAPLILAAGIGAAIGLGLWHLGSWLFGD
jgi:RHS repeat-associated protein